MANPFPAKIELHYADLPKDTRDRIIAFGNAPKDGRRVGNPNSTGMYWGALALGALLFMKFQAVTPIVFIVAALLTWSVGSRAIAPSFSFSPFHYLHPAFVLDAGYGMLVAYPIWHMTSVEIQHNLRNGIYQHSDVKMHFGSEQVSMLAKSQEQAQSLGRLALAHRDLALSLVGSGDLASIEGVDLIPEAVVSSGQKSSKVWVVMGCAVVVGLIATQMLPYASLLLH